jgi:hypothetical protein
MSQVIQFGPQQPSPLVALQIRHANTRPRLVIVDHDGFEIGDSDRCDIRLPHCGLPKLHSILHVQGGAVWIEAADDEARVSIGGEAFRRRALRDGDEISLGEFTLHIGSQSVEAARPVSPPHFSIENRIIEDRLSQLTAEELCDLIEVEENQTHDFDRRRRMGMQALLSAVQDVVEAEAAETKPASLPQVAAISDDRFDALVAQIRELSDALDERTRELAAQETLLLESSSQIAEVQRRVSRQLEQIIERIAPEAEQGELRVSA